MIRIAWICVGWLVLVGACRAASYIVTAHRDGDALVVEANADLAVTDRQAWEVLTDYDHLSEFVPDISESRVIERHGDRAVVEQKGRASFLFFRFSLFVRMEIEERPPHEVLAKAVAGSFQEMTGRYGLEPNETGVKLIYQGRFIPSFGVPRAVGNAAIKRAVENQFGAMVREIERRGGVTSGTKGSASHVSGMTTALSQER
jgi:carbon monoxide dehydrogenase subunit G